MNRIIYASVVASCLVVAVGCGDDGKTRPEDGNVDSSAEDASPNPAVSCSTPLVAPCDTTMLTSSPSCPPTMPTEGSDCLLTPQQDCYYCSGPESSWSSQHVRPLANCANGQWKISAVECANP